MIALLIMIVAFAVLGGLAFRYGADSRDGRDWQRECRC